MAYPLLDQIKSPADLRKLPHSKLRQVAREIRERTIEVVGKSGGHLASNLGVTELTIALHYVFEFREDRLLWDVGHQCYPHKLLTGRHAKFDQLRKSGGLSGFPSIHESEYDLFDVGHAGTAIPTAVGMARAGELLKNPARVVALVGDASIFNGVAFEGLNQAGTLKRQLLVILNDNQWGISPTQGGMAKHLAKFRVSHLYEEVKEQAKRILPKVPVVGKPVFNALAHLKEGIKATVSPHQIFEQLGFIYVGPTDGHDISHLIELLNVLKDVDHPVLLHVHTEKGKGAEWACAEPGKFHSPKPFTISDGKADIVKGSGKSWTSAFADALIERARKDQRIVAFTAGMPDGTGLSKFEEVFPERCRDIGIAESCTVDMAAGMAKLGLRPVCAIYSTFLQRALDQIFQEVVLQGLPVIFCLDRAGLVGGDGAVHHGFLDITYLRGMPRMVLAAPADESELGAALDFALGIDRPCAIRYPRDVVPEPGYGDAPPFEMGKSRLMKEGSDATIIAYGATVGAALEAAELLAVERLNVRVINARFAKPIDRNMLREVLLSGHAVLTVEDHTVCGGFGSAVLETAQELSLPTQQVKLVGMPKDHFVAQGARAEQLAEVGLDAVGLARSLTEMIDASSPPARRSQERWTSPITS
jgi:1-deoxy-D-xylulose-5-phosphate synthase